MKGTTALLVFIEKFCAKQRVSVDLAPFPKCPCLAYVVIAILQRLVHIRRVLYANVQLLAVHKQTSVGPRYKRT